MSEDRILDAILFSDIVGFIALMGKDEKSTILILHSMDDQFLQSRSYSSIIIRFLNKIVLGGY